eukprot:CAMPEP_0115388960 /NCGR_PEP_ID=MMETSP0271-20121206/9445_1 /TAXON_ID=71861 /ORGANISM="Scrippsiella trochoidea, Strain CCMP3099" /LENGTH=53 /DNA_ID=CAMNT_0002812467 /DNA_START=247 /DNA_END=408 /DNA_ORIENTATION=+
MARSFPLTSSDTAARDADASIPKSCSKHGPCAMGTNREVAPKDADAPKAPAWG